MKKKLLLFAIFLCVVIVVCFVAARRIKHTDDVSDSHGSTSSVSTGVKFYPGNEYNTPWGHYEDFESGFRYESVIECEVNGGALLFTVYDIHGYEGYDFKIMDTFTVVREERIDASGNYVYDLSDLSLGSYYLYICPEDEQVEATATYTFTRTRIE